MGIEELSFNELNKVILFANYKAARDVNATSDSLEYLSDSKDMPVRAEVARNLNTSTNTLEKLAQDKDYKVRAIVALNPNTQIHVLEQLSNDINPHVRAEVAKNSNLSSKKLNILLEDDIMFVKNAAKETRNRIYREKINSVLKETNITLLEKYAQDEDVSIRHYAALNSNNTLELIELLSNDKEEYVREAVAYNSNTPSYILDKLLAQNMDASARALIARHKNTSNDTLLYLLNDEDFQVYQEASKQLNSRNI